MIVRDEEQGIAAAILSLKQLPAVDQIVVLDTGSTDRTIGIARRLGAAVHEQRWTGDFSHHRNHCLDLCRNDWVIILDGDEVLDDPGNLNEFLLAPSCPGAGVRVDVVGESRAVESAICLRAFDKRVGRWKYAVHNQVVGVDQAEVSDARIVSYCDGTRKNAASRLQMLLQGQQSSPEDPHFPYFIVRCYRALEDYPKVVEWGYRFLALAGDLPQGAMVAAWLVEARFATREIAIGRAELNLALQRYPGFPDLHYWEMVYASLRWYSSAQQPNPRFLSLPCASQHLANRFPDAIEALELPIKARFDPD